ncbi:CDP-glycerol glycerophosphotransferase family protein [Sanguibacter sp. HDW7]|uniref:CDP-glycerol glycerophosphotransferase family protein n=1 Tax=Sanguibacter sp. HDW7 TaxID=2714931 RepID=UPI0014099F50|nr:CDP-glycerol glycerophosphotransferase family protein [Sanguibacter sp. HDW7]QIK82876.1 hypothetical protein G7063_03975 [Sanguibacter sp. HDW7]
MSSSPSAEQAPAANAPSVTVIVDATTAGLASAATLHSVEEAAGTVIVEPVVLVGDATPPAILELAQGAEGTRVVEADGDVARARRDVVARLASTYVYFLDGGDTLASSGLDLLVESAARNDAEVTVGGTSGARAARSPEWRTVLQIAGRRRRSRLALDVPPIVLDTSLGNKLFTLEHFAPQMAALGPDLGDEGVVLSAIVSAESLAFLPQPVVDLRPGPSDGAFLDPRLTLPETYAAALAYVESLYTRLVPTLSPRRATLVDLHVAALVSPLVGAAPEALGQDRADDFFARLARPLAGRPLDGLEKGGLSLLTRLRAAALTVPEPIATLAQVPTLTLSTAPAPAGARSDEPRLFADVPNLTGTRRRFSAVDLRAFIESLDTDADDQHLVMSVRIDIEDLPTNTLVAHDVEASVRAGRRTLVRLEPSPRRGDDGLDDGSWFVGRLPVADAPTGTHPLTLEVRAAGGPVVSTPLRATLGFRRMSRALHLPDLITQGLVTRRRTVDLRSHRGRLARLRHSLSLLRSDVGAVVRRQPLASRIVLRRLTAPFFMGRPVVVFGERVGTRQDNGWAAFEHARRSNPPFRAFYIDAASNPLRGIIRYGSLLHEIVYLHADALVSSHDIDGYMRPPAWSGGSYLTYLSWRIGAKRIWLQHGVIYNGVASNIARERTGFDAVVSSHPRETAYLSGTAGYGGRLHEIGLARFDLLTRTNPGSTILIAPTWRRHLVAPSYSDGVPDPETFTGSDYEQFFLELLRDPRLLEAARAADAEIVFLPHYEVAQHFATRLGSSSHVRIVADGGASFRKELLRARICVTDYSSISFDAAFLGVPMVYAPFDEDVFYGLHYRRGWFTVDDDGYGPVGRSVEDVVGHIIQLLEDTSSVEPLLARARHDFDPVRGNARARTMTLISSELAHP